MMSNALIVKRDLDKIRIDLNEAMGALGTTLVADDHEAIRRLATAGAALLVAVSSLTQAVERLAELPACDGSHE